MVSEGHLGVGGGGLRGGRGGDYIITPAGKVITHAREKSKK